MLSDAKKSRIKRILLVRPDAIGDVVLIVPSIVAIKKRYPDAHISVLLRSYTAELLKNHPAVNEVLIDDYAEKKIQTKKDFWRYVKDLKSRNFDAAIYFFNKSFYALAGAMAGIPVRVGDRSKLFFSWLYTHGAFLRWKDHTLHEVEYNLGLATVLGAATDNPDMRLYPADEDRAKVKNLLAEQGVRPDDFIVGIHLGTGGGNKPWHPEGYAGVINGLAKNHNLKFIVTGGKHEEPVVASLLEKTTVPIINLVGQSSLGVLMAIMERYNLYISVDTGPLHIAAGLKIPTVLISPTKNVKPTRWGPWGTRQLVVRKPVDCPLACSPRNCPDGRCLVQTTPEEVVAAAIELINGGGNTTYEEIFHDWCRKSFNILVVDTLNDGSAVDFANSLKHQGLNVVYAANGNPENNGIVGEKIDRLHFSRKLMRKFVDIIVKYDINIIHFIGKKPPFWFRIVSLWAALHIPLPPLVVQNTSFPDDCKDTDYLKYYVQAFRNL